MRRICGGGSGGLAGGGSGGLVGVEVEYPQDKEEDLDDGVS